MKEFYITLGHRIQHRRKELRLSQIMVAKQCGITNSHLCAIENARENPSLETIVNICDCLRVTPDYILLGNIHPNNIEQSLIESLKLCSESDVLLVRDFIELLVKRNEKNYNEENYV